MKYIFSICVTVFFCTNVILSQEKTITHEVGTDETINQIAQKYRVTPYDIFQLNPDTQSGLKPNMVLIIPKQAGFKATKTPIKATSILKTHKVLPKETMYGILKLYGLSEEELIKANPVLKSNGIQIGQELIIPSNSHLIAVKSAPEKAVYHEVLPKETKYSIAKKYGITIEILEKNNPEIITNLTVGSKILIKGLPIKDIKLVESLNQKKQAVSQKQIITNIQYSDYEIKPKETLYSLSKSFELTQEELIALNPDLKNGAEVGMVIKVPSKPTIGIQQKKEFASLSKIIEEGRRKKLVLLLPINIPNVVGDTLNSTAERLKKDKFLNMTMDFYSGALMAIDSAKVLGLPIDIEIYDSQENKNGSNVVELIKAHQLQNANAIIGPFYQSNAEVAAQFLTETNTPVISPLSKEVGNPYRNLYQTIPSPEVVKNTVFNYMHAKKGNIIAVVDRKKTSVLQYLSENQKDVPLVAFNGNSLSTESLKSMLVKDKVNFVVMETANTWMIKSTISTLIAAMPNYQVQLVILEPNETLDTDEITFSNLVKLRLMFPSVTRENDTAEAVIFEKNYKAINNIYPSIYATRGFDVTYDAMMRLVQDVKFEETVNTVATKQIDNQFEYYRKPDGGYTNKGVFILHYDSDLTIKEAK